MYNNLKQIIERYNLTKMKNKLKFINIFKNCSFRVHHSSTVIMQSHRQMCGLTKIPTIKNRLIFIIRQRKDNYSLL